MTFINLPWDRCWCFHTVRTGSIASAIYALVCALLRITGVVLEKVLESHEITSTSNLTTTDVAYDVEKSLWYVELVIGLLLLAAGVCLLLGILKHKAFLLIPFLALFAIIVSIEVLMCFMILLMVFLSLSMYTLIMLGLFAILLFVDASCFFCVISHFLNLRAGRESMRAVYRSQGERLEDYEEGAAALPPKGIIPTGSSMHFSTMSDMPVSSFDGEAPPPYREV